MSAAQTVDSEPRDDIGRSGDAVVLDSVSKAYKSSGRRHHLVLDTVDLTIGHGEFVSVIGPSGCGKTTLLRLVGGLVAPDTGEVLIDGETVQQASRKKAIGLVPQEPALLPWRDVLSNVRLGLEVNKRASKARRRHDPEEILRSMGLGDALERYPSQLSGGMRQRVALARAYVLDPDVLLMDEPFSALDELNRDQQRINLLEYWEKNRKSVLFVTHSVPEAVILSDRIIVMAARPGRIESIVDVDLPRPRTQRSFDDPRFHELETHVRELLRSVSTTGGTDD